MADCQLWLQLAEEARASTVNGRGRKSKDTGNWRLETGRTRILETGGWRQETGKTLKA